MKQGVNPMKVFLIILAVVLVAAAAVLVVLIYTGDLQTASLQGNVENGYFFGTCDGDVEKVRLDGTPVAVKGLENYTGLNSRTTSGYYVKQLRDGKNDKAVSLYNALLYAEDNGFNFISLPAAAFDRDTVRLAVYAAFCDLPTVDLNVQIGDSSSTLTLEDGTVSQRITVYITSGDETQMTYKKTAIEAAEAIVAELPADCTGDMDKAAYFYNWLVKNVKYTADTEYDAGAYYLMDALVGRVTNSYGFSSAYTLLLNLSGVNCVSVFDDPSGGYAWNIFRADGRYYQADAYKDAEMVTLGLGNLNLYFGHSAEAMGHTVHETISAITPACNDQKHDNDHIDAVVTGLETANKDQPQLVAARRKLDGGADYVTLRCDAFAGQDWNSNFLVISRWFAEGKVEFDMANSGDRICVLYPKK